MTYSKQIRLRNKELNKATKDLEKSIGVVDIALWIAIDRVLDRIFEGNDKLDNSVKSGANIARAGVEVIGFWAKEKRGFVRMLVDGLRKLLTRNRRYFQSMAPVPETLSENIARQLLQMYGYNTTDGSVIEGGWLDTINPTLQIQQRLGAILRDALVSGKSLKDVRKSIREMLAPKGKAGLLGTNLNRATFDIYQQFDRITQLRYATELGFTKAIYSGTVMSETRPFCEARNNRLFDLEVVKSWNEITWEGKNKYMDVLVALGGYNCRHHLSFVSDEIAAKIEKTKGLNQYNELTDGN